MKSIRMFLIVVLLCAWAHSALAAPPGHIELQTVFKQVKTSVDRNGAPQSVIVTANKIVPGDELVWYVNYTVIGHDSVTDAVITDPIPAHMTYVADSAGGNNAEVSFSVDGGRTWGPPADLRVKGADGTLRAALPADYTNIKWVVKGTLLPGTKGSVSFHAIVQ